MKVDTIKVAYNDLYENSRFSEKIRGYLGNKYKDNDILHNHSEDRFIYRYPLVQYKVIDKTPIVIGINDGVDGVLKIGVNDDELIIDNKKVESFQMSIERKSEVLGVCDDYISYEFKTPWIALNQKNINKYFKGNNIEREEMLKSILIGNVLSLCKGLGYEVSDRLSCWINFREIPVVLKDVKLVAFKGEFKINFNIPNYLGIGKSVSKGYGSVIKK